MKEHSVKKMKLLKIKKYINRYEKFSTEFQRYIDKISLTSSTNEKERTDEKNNFKKLYDQFKTSKIS